MTATRFPVFNAPTDTEQVFPKSMDIDEGDLTAIYESISIDPPKRPTDIPVTVVPSNTQTPVPSNDPFFHQMTQPLNSKPHTTPLVARMIRAIAEVDEETMRRVAMLPYVLSGYFQLLFNIALPAFFLYWVFSFGSSIASDVEKKVQLFSEEVMEQIAKCSRDYRENRCDPAIRVPALISACQAWEECMNRDPHLVAKRSGISAEIFGETINSFFNVLSWKSIASLVMLVVGIAVMFNFTFSMSRKEGNRRAHDLLNDSSNRQNSRRSNQLTNNSNTPRVRRRY